MFTFRRTCIYMNDLLILSKCLQALSYTENHITRNNTLEKHSRDPRTNFPHIAHFISRIIYVKF